MVVGAILEGFTPQPLKMKAWAPNCRQDDVGSEVFGK